VPAPRRYPEFRERAVELGRTTGRPATHVELRVNIDVLGLWFARTSPTGASAPTGPSRRGNGANDEHGRGNSVQIDRYC
jgi:hypothetical protein